MAILADILLASGDEPNLILLKISSSFQSGGTRFCLLGSLKRVELVIVNARTQYGGGRVGPVRSRYCTDVRAAPMKLFHRKM